MIEFRPLTPDDHDLFISYQSEFYHSSAVLHPIPPSYHEANFREIMRGETYLICRLIVADGENAGYALMSVSFSPEAAGRVIWIEELYVLPTFQSKGIGHAFFAYVHDHFPAARYRLEVEPDNLRAERLYSSLGYETLPYRQMIRE